MRMLLELHKSLKLVASYLEQNHKLPVVSEQFELNSTKF